MTPNVSQRTGMLTSDADPVGSHSGPTAGAQTGDRPWWTLTVLAISQLMVVLDVTIVNIALPSAQADLGFSTASRQWVITAYALAFGGLLVVGGRVGDRFGRRGAFLLGAAGFAAASAVGGLAINFGMLVAARALQGAFGALMAPAALSLLTVSFAGSTQRSKAFGVWSATSAAGGAIGLLLGGVLTEYLSWRWCLLVNVFFAAIVLVGGARLLPRSQDPSRPPINLVSAVVVSAGLFGVVYGLSKAESDGWDNWVTLGSLALGMVLLAAFFWLQTRIPEPLLPLRVLSDRLRSGALLAIFFTGGGMFGVFLFVTFYVQQVLGFSSVLTGVAFLPMVVMLAAFAQVGTRVLVQTGPRPLVVLGAIGAAAAMAWFTRLDTTSSYAGAVLGPLMLFGLGCGLIFAAALSVATVGLRTADAGVGSALVSTAQQIGGAVGIALLSTAAATAAQNKAADLLRAGHLLRPTPAVAAQAAIAAYQTAFWWASGMFVAAALLCALVLPPGPAPIDAPGTPALG